MNRTSVLACIDHHLRAARMEPGGLRPLGELIPRIAVELRAGSDISCIQASVIPIPLVAAFIDGLVSPQEELVICQSILIDNSVLAELVAGVLALDEMQPNVNALPPLSRELSSRLFELTSQAFPIAANEAIAIAVTEQVDASEYPHPVPPSPIRKSNRTGTRAKAAWLRPTFTILAVAASLLLIVWWSVQQSSLWQKSEQVVQVPPKDTEPIKPTDPDDANHLSPPEDGLAVQAPEEIPQMPLEQSPLPTPPDRRQDRPLDKPQVVVTPSIPPARPSEEFAVTPMKNIQWSKIAGLLAKRDLNRDYEDEAGWHGVIPGDDGWAAQAADARQLLTFPLSRAEADVGSGGRIVLAADTRLTFAQGLPRLSAKVGLSHGLIAFVDMPENTVIEFTGNELPLAIVKWTTTQASLLVTISDAGLQAQVTGGEVTINQQNVRNSVVSIDSQSVNELRDRNTRLPAWVTRPVETIPLPKSVLGQLAGSDNIAETLDRLLEASATTGDADKGRLMLSNWRASLSDSNLIRSAESRSPLVRLQAFGRLMLLPEWDERYKHSWARFSSAINNEAEFVFLRQAFELTRRGGKLNAVQIMQLGNLLESPQFTVRSLSDFILRKNFGGGPQFDPNLNPLANTRGIGLWKRYINAIRNNNG